MEGVAHGMKPRGGKGPSKAVAREFVAADKAEGKYDATPSAPPTMPSPVTGTAQAGGNINNAMNTMTPPAIRSGTPGRTPPPPISTPPTKPPMTMAGPTLPSGVPDRTANRGGSTPPGVRDTVRRVGASGPLQPPIIGALPGVNPVRPPPPPRPMGVSNVPIRPEAPLGPAGQSFDAHRHGTHHARTGKKKEK